MDKQQTKTDGWLKTAFRRYFIDAMSAMALGLFSSLIIGLIISQLSTISFLSWLKPFADMVAASSPVVGSAIGVAIAYGLKAKPLVLPLLVARCLPITTLIVTWCRLRMDVLLPLPPASSVPIPKTSFSPIKVTATLPPSVPQKRYTQLPVAKTSP